MRKRKRTQKHDTTVQEELEAEAKNILLHPHPWSPQRVASASNLCNDRCQWAGNMSKGEYCYGFGEKICSFISGKSSMPETHWKFRTTREKRKSKRFQISQKDFVWRNVWAVETGEESKGRLGIG